MADKDDALSPMPQVNKITVTDEMVEAAREAVGYNQGIGPKTMRTAIEAALGVLKPHRRLEMKVVPTGTAK